MSEVNGVKIEQLSDERIVVELSARDMDELEITYEDMDYANIETRRVIWTLLDRAGRTLGRDIDPSGRMMIEVIPRREGGCVLQFTLIGTTKVLQSGRKPPLLPRSTKPPCLVFAFASIDPVMDAARAWVRFGAPLPEHAALYEKSGQYRLILTPGKRPGAICAFIKEWGDLLPGGNMTAAATREYWQEIVAESALERLAGVEA
ncbi:MAG: adaptor protein MecA [Oscillospiraceae bacterium]|jgi:negative regulator of genetic competence, sporulation and motility|nr:adaptor protein MecA [Oscillospiraceae bacterium]